MHVGCTLGCTLDSHTNTQDAEKMQIGIIKDAEKMQMKDAQKMQVNS